MKPLLYIAFLICSTWVLAQRNYVYGYAVDTSRFPLIDVYIRNLNAGLITSTDQEGDFKIPAQIGDTVTLSYVGYEIISKIVDEEWVGAEQWKFQFVPTTTLLDEVTVTRFPEYQQFKEQVLAADPEDTAFQVYGVPRVVIRQEDRLNASLKIRGPFSAVHNTFSKRAKEQKKLRKVLQNQGTRDKARQKFTRDWVAEQTKLEGDKLTRFIAYCNFSEEYLVNTSEYMIYEDMMALLPKFLEEYKDQEG